jgi:hypothetical protein
VKTAFKGHDIEVTGNLIPIQLVGRSKSVISWADGEKNESRRFFGPPSGLKSKPDAERWGLKFTRQWIDDGKPELKK